MLVLFLALQVFSASASLHEELHCDAASDSHECAVTLLSQGHIDLAAPIEFAPLAHRLILSPGAYVPPAVSAIDFRISISRGPPSLI